MPKDESQTEPNPSNPPTPLPPSNPSLLPAGQLSPLTARATLAAPSAADVAKADEYFQPYSCEYTDSVGRVVPKVACGGRLVSCRKCSYRYDPVLDRAHTYCPQCGESRRCQSPGIKPSCRCISHGGKSDRGREHSKYKGDSYRGKQYKGVTTSVMEALPSGLADHFRDFLKDPDILSLRGDIALMLTNLQRQISGLEGDSLDWRKRLLSTWREMLNARKLGTEEGSAKAAAALNKLGQQIQQGAAAGETWRDIEATIGRTSRLKDQELTHIERQHMLLTAEQAMGMLALIGDTNHRAFDEIETSSASLLEVVATGDIDAIRLAADEHEVVVRTARRNVSDSIRARMLGERAVGQPTARATITKIIEGEVLGEVFEGVTDGGSGGSGDGGDHGDNQGDHEDEEQIHVEE